MGKIYRSAVRTVIWLTDGFVGDEKTFTMLRRMQQTVGSKIADGSFDTDSLLWKDAHLDIEKEVEKPSDDEVAALWKVLRLPWFRRVWVIQECALAKDVLVTCGSQEMDWEDFFSGAVSTFFMGWHTGGQSTSTVFLTLFKINFARLGAAEGDETHELHLLTLLNNFRTSLATDPRDKIYAFFGLTNSPLKQLRLAPNYRTDTIDVYINLAKALIRDCDTLDILSVPRRAAGLALPLPSWCPDWMDTDVHENSLFARDEADNDDYPTKPFSASGFSTLPIPTFQPGNRLGLKGYRIDRVTSTSDWIPQTDQMQFDVLQTKADTVLSTGRGLRDLYKYVYVSLEGIAAQVDTFAVWDAFVFGPDDHDLETRYLFTNETREAAYMRTVCADFLPQGHDFALEAFRAWRKERWAQRWLRKGKVDRIPAGHSFLNAISTVIPNKEENQAFLGVLSEAKMRRLFWTEKGYLGMGPYDLEVNDEVWLIQGCRVPLVLRRTARTTERERIGDCYLHGSMYGERFNERQCGPVILI